MNEDTKPADEFEDETTTLGDVFDEDDLDVQEYEANEEKGIAVERPEYRDFEARYQALNMAAASLGVSGQADVILNGAQRFLDFLQGEDSAADEPSSPFPYEVESGVLILGPNVALTPDAKSILWGDRLYRFVGKQSDADHTPQ